MEDRDAARTLMEISPIPMSSVDTCTQLVNAMALVGDLATTPSIFRRLDMQYGNESLRCTYALFKRHNHSILLLLFAELT